MRIESFDIDKVIENGCRLLASDGKEFDLESDHNSKEYLLNQRMVLNKKLGLDNFGENSDFISTDDLMQVRKVDILFKFFNNYFQPEIKTINFLNLRSPILILVQWRNPIYLLWIKP